METGLTFRLLLVGGLVAANAFFVVAEFALVRVRPTRLRELADQGHSSAQVAIRLAAQMDQLLSGTQLGVTMASLGLGWTGENTLAELFLPLVLPLVGPQSEALAAGVAHSISLALAFVGVTVMHIVFGELVPKTLGLSRSDRLAMLVARPMELFITATYPFMKFINSAAGAVSRMMGASSVSHRQVHSAEELKMLIAAGREVGLLPAAQEAMIHRVFDLDRLLVREVMVPRPDIVSVPVTIALDELLRLVMETKYSRIPVHEESPEKIIGVLSTKDLFRVWSQAGASAFQLRPLLRRPLIVPETKPLGELLQEFLQHRRQLALVVDEFGRIAGLVTVEDVLEAVVGEIEDEFDLEERPRLAPTDRRVDLDGATSLLDLENLYGIILPREQGFETLAGFLLWQLGRIPEGGESFNFEKWRFTVLEMERRRIARIRVEKTAA